MVGRNLNDFHLFCRKIVGIGRNYAAHAQELGNEVPKTPMLFLKPPSSIVKEPNPIEIPKGALMHHEVELGVVIGTGGANISAATAMNHVGGYVVSLDMTARNWQNDAKKSGSPWAMAKGFDTFTPISDFIPASKVGDPHNLRLWCSIDGQLQQDGHTGQMIFKIPTLIEYISSVMHLEAGDLILTGTPMGVGEVEVGHELEAGLGVGADTHLAKMTFGVAKKGGFGRFSW